MGRGVNDTERALARTVGARPAADGHYYDPVMAAIADRDELLATNADLIANIRVWVEFWTAQEGLPWNPALVNEGLSLMLRQFRIMVKEP